MDGHAASNLILTGTEDDPLVINGRIAVEGDVVIQGKVKGAGSIWARGNIYVVGDTTYADGTDGDSNRTFGTADDGTTNALGLAAGGNVIVGDYLTTFTRKGWTQGDPHDADNRTTGDRSGEFSFAIDQVAIFNRREYARTVKTLPDNKGKQVANPNYVEGYTPRYYVQNPGDPVHVFLGKTSYWDSKAKKWGGGEHPFEWKNTISIAQKDLPAGAVTLPFSPGSGWMTEKQLKQIVSSLDQKKREGERLLVDALIYTDNMIYAASRSNMNSAGKATLNGGLIAKDTGVLIPRGLELNYDERVQRHLGIVDYSETDLRRGATWLQRRASSHEYD